SAVAIAAAAPFAGDGPAWLLPVLFCLYGLTFFLLVNHYWTYAAEAFDALAAKRLFPLLAVGSSLGGVAGGALAAALKRPEILLGLWAALLLAALPQLHRRSPEPTARKSPLQDISEG